MTYKTSLDKTAIVITIAVTILFAGIIFGQVAMIKDTGKAIPIFTIVALLLTYFVAFAFRPTKYTISEEELVIHRPLRNVHIKKSAISAVTALQTGDLSGAIRTFGVGGLFGYYGKFANFSIAV